MNKVRNPIDNIIMTRSLLTILLLCAMHVSWSQDVKTGNIRWSVENAVDLKSNSPFTISCAFITEGTQRIVWEQKNGTAVFEFTIVSVSGTWTDAAEDGKLVYSVTEQDLPGTITLERNNGQATIRVDLSQGDANGIHHQYSITAYTLNP